MDLKSHIGRRVKSARKRAGLTQEELAAAVSKAVETISNIERGSSLTGLDTLERISREVNAPLVSFFEGYRPGRATSRRRAELQQRLEDHIQALTTDQIGLALTLIEAIRSHYRHLQPKGGVDH
jgi:transcriptional regulator with XRE-family HTH domain